jgi:hypothetical protein
VEKMMQAHATRIRASAGVKIVALARDGHK